MPSGGTREGAGRPSGTLASSTIQTQIQRHRLVVLLEGKVEAIFKALADKAVKGDVPAAKELFDRAWGKAHQSITLDGKIETETTVVNEEARIAAGREYARVLKSKSTV